MITDEASAELGFRIIFSRRSLKFLQSNDRLNSKIILVRSSSSSDISVSHQNTLRLPLTMNNLTILTRIVS